MSTGWEPGRWWRVVRDVPHVTTADIYSESSDEDEQRRCLGKCPWKHVRLERHWSRTQTQWRPE